MTKKNWTKKSRTERIYKTIKELEIKIFLLKKVNETAQKNIDHLKKQRSSLNDEINNLNVTSSINRLKIDLEVVDQTLEVLSDSIIENNKLEIERLKDKTKELDIELGINPFNEPIEGETLIDEDVFLMDEILAAKEDEMLMAGIGLGLDDEDEEYFYKDPSQKYETDFEEDIDEDEYWYIHKEREGGF